MSNSVSDYRQLVDVSYRNSNNVDEDLNIRFRKPDILKKNLDRKLIRVNKFFTNNRYIPIFIPDRIKTTETSYYNIVTNPATNTLVLDTLTPDSLKYFITIRNLGTGNAETIFLQQIPEQPNLVAPSVVIDDDNNYYLEEYYWYHDIMPWLSNIQASINTLANNLGGASQCNITFSEDGFTFYFLKTFTDTFDVIFSESLIKMFPLRSYLSPYITNVNAYLLKFSDFEVSSGSSIYRSIACPLYENSFPFAELLITSQDMGVNYTMFLDEGLLRSNVQNAELNNTFLAYTIRTNQFNRIYDFYSYNSDNDSLWNNFYSDENTNQYLDIQINLRLKNGIIVPFKLKSKELFTITFEVLARV